MRFALFHLLGCAPTTGEAPVGARGLTGLAYAGHVFWDADVFVLPALAATLPAAARAMLEYRIRRIPAARSAARVRGQDGLRFPWESAETGVDVTPAKTRNFEGRLVPIRTAEHEEHVNADIAWAALHYQAWTGDSAFLRGPGRALVIDTARWWASRIRLDASGRGHLYGVVGPDEYHEVVDDNAFTNLMARWHLRQAATLIHDTAPGEAASWCSLASALVDGYDPETSRHEQFAGFSQLEPLLINDFAPPPVAADVLLGQRRVAGSQLVKQPDVLMAHHLLDGELPAGSLAADLDYYLPRTAHGSSLSPAICAALLARAGRPDEALALFEIAGRLDLDDLTGTTAGGLHLATMGGLWQCAVFGFAGIRPRPGVLQVDPRLPQRWSGLSVHLRYRGEPVHVVLDAERVEIAAATPLPVRVGGVLAHAPVSFVKVKDHWRESR